MAGGDMRNIIMIEDGEDRISDLPVHLREHILDCMSIKDAVATSVLSSNWRYCWTGLRELKFDKNFWGFGKRPVMVYPSHARAVDRFLMLHFGPIREFTLFVPPIEHITVDINMWLRVLSNNGVHKIVINGYYNKMSLFPIPSGLFNCRELKELILWNCKLITLPSYYKGFANLTTLGIYRVKIDSSLLESLISECLHLETLSLELILLKKPFALEALNLKTFYFNDRRMDFFIFKNIPKLTCVSLLPADRSHRMDVPQPYATLELLGSLSMIKELTYDFILLEPLHENCPSSTPTLLENLKCLTLRSVNLCLSKDILFTLCLLRSAPNLQNLTIHLQCFYNYGGCFKEQEAAAKLLKSEAQKHTSYDNLQTIKITGMQVSPSKTLLINLFQTRCREVKIIITKPS
ncbi:unnamed protein product [Rhodiola kirilowii]